MKRIISACVEQTQKFETENDLERYINSLARKRIKYKIVDRKQDSDNTVMLKIIMQHSNFPVGDYLD
ncbi:MAG: hypothetical protein LBS53_10470 [Synergistaceae bacterium]|jgi:hypothetical protein|nr:hypothetical protein [Synergistaceae bacterium]